MRDVHPGEVELARWSDDGAGEEIAAHLRWCARCRSIVADYRWLQGEVEGALAVAADIVAAPRPQWWAVREGMCVSQRQVAGWRASALTSILLSVCLMLFAPVFLSPAGATPMEQPKVAMVPGPITAPSVDEVSFLIATPTPELSCEGIAPAPTPVVVLPPTPPDSEL